jgi:hypothetical protein
VVVGFCGDVDKLLRFRTEERFERLNVPHCLWECDIMSCSTALLNGVAHV